MPLQVERLTVQLAEREAEVTRLLGRVETAEAKALSRDAKLAELSRLPGVGNAQVLVRQHRDELVFLHQVVEGAADKSWGVHVARLAGVPAKVIERARDLLLALEADATAPAKPRRKPAAAEQKSLFE